MPYTHNVITVWFTTSRDCVQESLPSLSLSAVTLHSFTLNSGPGDPPSANFYLEFLFIWHPRHWAVRQ